MVDAFIYILNLLFECLGVAVFMCVVWYLVTHFALGGKDL